MANLVGRHVWNRSWRSKNYMLNLSRNKFNKFFCVHWCNKGNNYWLYYVMMYYGQSCNHSCSTMPTLGIDPGMQWRRDIGVLTVLTGQPLPVFQLEKLLAAKNWLVLGIFCQRHGSPFIWNTQNGVKLSNKRWAIKWHCLKEKKTYIHTDVTTCSNKSILFFIFSGIFSAKGKPWSMVTPTERGAF